ncbi:MAG: tetraacyldisaccharide 4'-kinase [bacterium]
MKIVDLRRLRIPDGTPGAAAKAALPLLVPLSAVYAGAMGLWRWLPRRGVRLEAPVVSVGSIMVGGTGKTPLCIAIAQGLLGQGLKTCILSRGYMRKGKRTPLVVSDARAVLASVEEAGDEPYLMARRLPGVCVVVGKNRLEAAREAASAFQPDVFVLDDGFQTRSLVKDLEIVTVSGASLRSPQFMLPAGRLREGWWVVKPAHALVVLLEAGDPRPTALPSGAPPAERVFWASRGPSEVLDHQGHAVYPDPSKIGSCLVLSAIARPEAFERTCLGLGLVAPVSLRMDDHHWYNQDDSGRVISLMAAYGCERLLTTEKDFHRLPEALLPRALMVRSDLRLEDPAAFWRLVNQRVRAV